jgi:hypothetical protein
MISRISSVLIRSLSHGFERREALLEARSLDLSSGSSLTRASDFFHASMIDAGVPAHERPPGRPRNGGLRRDDDMVPELQVPPPRICPANVTWLPIRRASREHPPGRRARP